MSKTEERELCGHLARLSHEAAQQVLDELAGRLNTTVVRNPIRYCLSLINRLERGLFTPELGLQLAQRREAGRRHEAAHRARPAVSISAGQGAIPLPDAIRAMLERMRSKSAGAKEIGAHNADGSSDLSGQETPE